MPGPALNSPYGVVYYYSTIQTRDTPQVISDIQTMVPAGGGWFRAQLKWSGLATTTPTTGGNGLPIYPATDTFDWTVVDDLVTKCNAANPVVNLLYCIQSAPSWRQTIDLGGNAVGYDGQYVQGSLHQSITGGTPPTGGLIYVDIPSGQTISNNQQITLDYQSNTLAEAILTASSGGPYVGPLTNQPIAVTNLSGFVWHPKHSHSTGIAQSVQNTGGQFVNTADTLMYVKALVDRYNGTSGHGIIQCLQWNEDFDTPGTNPQRDVQSKWFVGPWQSAGAYIRAHHPSCLIGGPACRRTFVDNSNPSNPYGLGHVLLWFDNIFNYDPGTGIRGCIQWLDFLDFHYYRDGVVDASGNPAPDPNVALPATGGAGYNIGNVGYATPTPARELECIRVKCEQYGYPGFDIWCTETGWNVTDDGNGTTGTTNAAYNSSPGGYTAISLSGAGTLSAAIADQAPITIDYANYPGGGTDLQEVVYCDGGAASGATSIPITSVLGAHTGWTPAHNHASGAAVYSGTFAYVTYAQQGTYITEAFDQHRLNGGSHVFIWTDNPNTSVQEWKNPPFSNNQKTITGQIQTQKGGSTPFGFLTAATNITTYAASHPSWPGLKNVGVRAVLRSKVTKPLVVRFVERTKATRVLAVRAKLATLLNKTMRTRARVRAQNNKTMGVRCTLMSTGSTLFPGFTRRTGTLPTTQRRTGVMPTIARRSTGLTPATSRRVGPFPSTQRRGS